MQIHQSKLSSQQRFTSLNHSSRNPDQQRNAMKFLAVLLIFSVILAYVSATPLAEIDDYEHGAVSSIRNRRFLCSGYASDQECRNHCVNDLGHWMGGSCVAGKCKCLD